MRSKVIVFLVAMLSSVALNYNINKAETIDTKTETKHIEYSREKDKKEKKVKGKSKPKPKKTKTKEQEQLEYWTNILGRKVAKVTKIKAKISFYTSLGCENGGYAGITASGKRLREGMVANNCYSFGTNIYFKGYGLKEVQDRGANSVFGNYTSFDVFVPRNYGESDSQYFKRVNNMGVKTVTAYVFKFEEE